MLGRHDVLTINYTPYRIYFLVDMLDKVNVSIMHLIKGGTAHTSM